ncbi:TAF5-like RNA polymerase subunit [Sarcoptes scabiei]|uniref:TAF5-like RNA polymerase subunit n=1 Tax=Sarcoptes scabiei TaxID=52283 RepID=A0A834R9N9_SARSC|nr:TAF5-like RNA polymerase subunit [Sarcoptes scabiei]
MEYQFVDDEILQSILSEYVKTRNYKNSSSSSSSSKNLSESEPAARLNIDNNGTVKTSKNNNILCAKDWFLEGALSAFQSTRNVTSFRLNEDDFVKEVELAFQKFIEFIQAIRSLNVFEESRSLKSTSKPIQYHQHAEEIWMTTFPLFVHIFIQLFEYGHISNAQKFFMEHYQKFTKKMNHIQFLNSMQTSLTNKILSPALQNFKNFKYRIIITEDSFNLLNAFLRHEQYLSILQTFNSCLDFRLMTREEFQNQHNLKMPFKSTHLQNDTETSSMELLQQTENFNEINETLEIIKSLRNLEMDKIEKFPTKASQTKICSFHIKSRIVSSIEISTDLSKIAIGNEDSQITLWDFDLTDEIQYFSSRVYKHWRRIPIKRIVSEIDFKFHSDNDDGRDESKNEEVCTERLSENVEPLRFRGHSGSINEMCFLYDSNLLLSCSNDSTIRSWDVNSTACLAIYKGHSDPIWTIDSNRSGSFISGGRCGIAYMWDIERTVPLRIYSGHSIDINDIKFHPNCNYLATASADKSIILWDVNQVRQVRMFCGHNAPVTSVKFSSCGKYIVSASSNGSLRIWDISQGKCLLDVGKNESYTVQRLAFGPKDNLLANCGIGLPIIDLWEDPIRFAHSNQKPPFISIDLDSIYDSTETFNKDENLFHLKFIRYNVLMAFSKLK